jgi:predicted PurR-regulated permease PerM
MAKPLYIWLLAVLALCLLFIPYVTGALIGVTLGVALFPLYRHLAEWFYALAPLKLDVQRARVLGATATGLATVLVLCVGLLMPALVLYKNSAFLTAKGLALYQHGRAWGQERLKDFSRRHGGWAGQGGAGAGLDPAASAGPLEDLLANPGPLLMPLALRTLGSAAAWGVQLMVMLLILHVTLLYGPGLWAHLLAHAPPAWRWVLQRLGSRARDVLRASYFVHGLTAIAAFLIAVPVFWVVAGPPYYFLAAVLAGIFQFVPFLGSVVLVAGMTLYYFFNGNESAGWLCLLLAFPLVVGVPDLVVRPALARSQGHVSGFTMLIGFMAGLEAFGLAGFVLGPLLVQLFVSFTAIMLYGPGAPDGPLLIEEADGGI